jgi:hypothetical protein
MIALERLRHLEKTFYEISEGHEGTSSFDGRQKTSKIYSSHFIPLLLCDCLCFECVEIVLV